MQRLFLATLVLLLGLTPAARAADDIVIGVSAPLTGPAASISEISVPGLKQAVADINARGGVQGKKLRLEVVDDACDPKQAVTAANKLIGMHLAAVISVSCSTSVKPAMPIYEEEGIPLVVSLASSPDLGKQGDKLFFRLGYTDTLDALTAADFMAARFSGKSVAVIDDKTSWGQGMAAAIDKSLHEKGFATVDHYQVNAGEQDYSALVSRLKEKHYDVVYPALYMREGGLLLRQMNEAAYHPIVIGCMTIAMPDALAIMGPAQEGMYFTRLTYTPNAKALSEKLNGKDSYTGVFNIQAYAAVEVLAQAIDKGGYKADGIANTLKTDTFQTVLGQIKFDANGEITNMPFEVLQMNQGHAITVKP